MIVTRRYHLTGQLDACLLLLYYGWLGEEDWDLVSKLILYGWWPVHRSITQIISLLLLGQTLIGLTIISQGPTNKGGLDESTSLPRRELHLFLILLDRSISKVTATSATVTARGKQNIRRTHLWQKGQALCTLCVSIHGAQLLHCHMILALLLLLLLLLRQVLLLRFGPR